MSIVRPGTVRFRCATATPSFIRIAGDGTIGTPLYEASERGKQPLERDLEVTGPVTLRLWIASDSPDTDFTAKLIDVHPPNNDYRNGFAVNLTEGVLGCRYCDSW